MKNQHKLTQKEFYRLAKRHKGDPKSNHKDSHYNKIDGIVPLNLEHEVLRFEKTHRRMSHIDDVVAMFKNMEPHSSSLYDDNSDTSSSYVSQSDESVFLKKIKDFIDSVRDMRPDLDQYVSILEDLMMLAYAYYVDTDFVVTISMVTLMLKRYTGGSLSKDITSFLYSLFDRKEKEAQSNTIRDFIVCFKTIRHSEFFKNLNSILGLAITFGFVNPVNVTVEGVRLFANAGCKIAKDADDFFGYVLDLLSYFFEAGYEFYLGNFGALFSRDELSRLDDDIRHLGVYIDSIRLGSYVKDTGNTIQFFQNKMMHTFETLKFLQNSCNDKITRQILASKLTQLSRIMVLYDQYRPLEGIRECPYCISVFGPSAVGKSSLVNMLMVSILKFNGRAHDDSNICVIQNNDKFYSTFRADTTGVLLDDVANTRHDKAAANPADMIISLVNNVSYYAPKADVSEKGKIQVNPSLVALTTNVKDLSASDWSVEPISVVRRVNVHITVTVKPEYATNGKLDAGKIPASVMTEVVKYGIADYWLLTLETARPVVTNSRVSCENYDYFILNDDQGVPMEDVDIYTAIDFLTSSSKKHFSHQASLLSATVNSGEKFSFCESCGKFKHRCHCSLNTGLHTDVSDNIGKHPQSNFAIKVFESASSLLAKGIYDKIWGMANDLTPSWFERFIYKNPTKFYTYYTARVIANDYLSLINYVPISTRETSLYRNLHYYIHRKHIRRWTFYTGYITALGCTCWGWYYGHSPRSVAINVISLTSFTVGIGNRIAYYSIMDRLRTAPLHSIMESEKVVQASSVVLKTGVTLVAGSLFCAVVKKLYNLFSIVPQGNLQPKSECEIRDRDAEKNIWAKTYVPLETLDSTITMTADQFLNKIRGNCLHLSFDDTKRTINVACVALKSNLFMCPLHFFFEKSNIHGNYIPGTYLKDGTLVKDTLQVKIIRSSSENAYYFKTDIYISDIVRVANHDLCIFRTWNGGTFLDITDYFPESHYMTGPIKGIYRTCKGTIVKFNGSAKHQPTFYKVGGILGKQVNIIGGEARYDILTEKGMCTAVLVNDAKSPRIIGLHIAGVGKTSEASYVTPFKSHIFQAINTLIKQQGNLEPHSSGECKMVRYKKDISYSTLIDPQAPVNYVENHNYIIRGSVDVQNSYYSKVTNTFISDSVCRQFNIHNKWGKPKFGPQRWKPWYSFLEVASEPCNSINPSLLKRAKIDYLSILFKFQRNYTNEENFLPLTMSQVLNGKHGVRFIDSMNFQSSVGFPLTGKKSRYLEGEPGNFKFVDPDLFMDEIHVAENLYKRGKRYYPIFKACLKDEPVDVNKDKVRVFHAADMTLQLMWRKYGLPVLRFLSVYPLLSECAVGINPGSDEWNQMHEHVTFNGECNDRIIAGDYSKWDIRLPPDLVGMAFQVILELAEQSGYYTSDDLNILRGLSTDTIYYMCHFNGTLIEMCGGVPSGHNLTAHINSIANSLLLRCGYFDSGGQGPFRSHCHVMTYGDDFFGGAKNSVGKFNHLYYKKFLEQHSMVLTMPDKTSQATPFMNIFSCDFLKRKSVLCKFDGKYYGALSVDSMLKSLLVRTDIKIGSREHIYNSVIMFQRELSYHDEDTYNYYMRPLREVCAEHTLLPYELHYSYLQYYEFRNGIENHLDYSIHSKPGHTVDGYPITPEASIDNMSHLQSSPTVLSEMSSSQDEFDWGLKINELTENNNKQLRYLDTKIQEGCVDPLQHMKPIREPHSAFGDGPGVNAGSHTETGTAVITTGQDDKTHDLGITMQDMLSLRQDDSRSLGNYLSRPVRIFSVDLTTNINGIYDRILPLDAFLTSNRVRDKIRGYAYLNARLHVKISVTSAPTTAGALQVALHPWVARDNGLGAMSNTVAINELRDGQISQLPNILVNLASESGGEISMPIISPSNGLNITERDQIRHAFMLHIKSLTPVRLSANAISTPTLNIYVWLSDVSLTGTTTVSELPEPQSNEYQKDSCDTPASTDLSFSQAMGAGMSGLVGKGTELAVDRVLATMGLSAPIDPDGTQSNVMRMSTNMANYNSPQRIDSLAGDIKNEVSVGTAELGFEDVDHMAFDNVLSRWSLVDVYDQLTGSLSSTSGVRTYNVSPLASQILNVGGQECYVPTALSIAALAFGKWRGSIKYKFIAVGSAFMKGRIRIAHDVNSNSNINPDNHDRFSTQELNSTIWDISLNRSVEVEIPWTSNLTFKETGLLRKCWAQTNVEGKFDADPSSNGRLMLNIIAPLSDLDHPKIDILVYICGVKGMAFGDLRAVLANYTFAGINHGVSGIPEPQSNEDIKLPIGISIDETGNYTITSVTPASLKFYEDYVYPGYKLGITVKEPQSFAGAKGRDTTVFANGSADDVLYVNIAGLQSQTEDNDAMALMCLGEKWFSMRQVIKRYTHNFTRNYSYNQGANQIVFRRLRIPDRPLLKGWQGPNSLNIDPTGVKCTYARDSFLSFYSMCFLGYRGSYRHKLLAYNSHTAVAKTMWVARATPGYLEESVAYNTTDPIKAPSAILLSPDMRAGGTIGCTTLNPLLEYTTPFQCRGKFAWAQDRTPYTPKTSDDGGYDVPWHQIAIIGSGTVYNNVRLDKFIAAGDDFSLFFYLYAPIMTVDSPGVHPQA